LIPPTPEFRSSAEETVWRRLKAQLPPEAFLAANLALQSHEDRYEADLVVGLPGQGFVVIEVKGGHVQHTDAGWVQATRDGLKPIDPAGQADRAKRLLDSYVRRRGWAHGPIRFEHMVAFPDMDFGPEPLAPDLPRWAVIAAGDLNDAAGKVWDALDKRLTDMQRPGASWVAEIADLIGGRLDPAAALLGTARAREEYCDLLTRDQFAALRFARSNPRLKLVGGPGTGKTWLALEQARTWAVEGKRVLFVCYSIGLSRWLAQAVAAFGDKVAQRIDVSTYSAYLVGRGVPVPESPDQAWWEVTLPQLAAELVEPAYDALVVDEAQDFADSWWPLLLASLRESRMLVAGDEQQTVFANRRGAPDVELHAITLDENVRNTTQIASVFNPLASERMRFRGGEGPPVRFVSCAQESAHDVADSVVEELLERGHAPGSIAVLTTGHRHTYHRQAEEQLQKHGYWDGFWLDDEVFYGTVMGFKGLERPVVVLAVDGFHDGVARNVMYAGLSRARDELVVCGDPAAIREVVGKEVARRLVGG
jgi:hypothetical protein